MKYVYREFKVIWKRFFDNFKIAFVGMDVKLDSVYREVESQRIKTNFVNIIPFSVFVIIFELSSGIFNIAAGDIWYCRVGTGVACLSFLLFNIVAYVFLERTLASGDATDKSKEYFTYLYWGVYVITASLINSFETISSGSISSFFLTVFSLTSFAMLEPKPIFIYYFVIAAEQTAVTIITKSSFEVLVFSLFTVAVGLFLSIFKYCTYMNRSIETKRFERISEIDPLTGLLNRRGMQRSVDGIWSYCKKHSIPITFAMLDIDYFKKYNDKYGHSQGDECIKMIAECIKQTFSRRTDITCRFGGEEFIIIVAGESEEKALEQLKCLKREIENLKIKSGCPEFNENVTVSMGIHSVDIDSTTMFRDAVLGVDAQLYNAKEHGRNCISRKNEIIR